MRFLVVFSLFFNVIFAQNNYPKDYFSPPLAIPMQLSGNFGELRPNHFHAGFDFKTQQKEGLAVYAAANGYISRIKISTFGNGKTLYLTHPNGYTTVYAHLQKAVGEIQDYIIQNQYKEKTFEIELFLKPGELAVKKGEQIAWSGNTGASEGPHLHFEIRDSKTENIINPLFFGFGNELKDSKKPLISGLYVYPMESSTVVNKAQRPILVNMNLQKDGSYLADKVLANGKIGFGIIADDFDDVSINKNGIYSVHTFVNGQESFGYQFETNSFDDMRYVNALIDYSFYKKTKLRVQKLFMKNKYGLPFIKSDQSRGMLTPAPNLSLNYRIEVADFNQNKSVITIPVEFDSKSALIPATPSVSNYFIKFSKDNIFEKDGISVFFPANTFYEDFALNFEVKNKVLFLHEDTVPAHTSFTISITDSKISQEQRDKTFIARLEGDQVNYINTYKKDSVFTAKSKILGKFKLVSDTIAPKISLVKPMEGKLITDNFIQFHISDQNSGIKSYNGYLNGKWVLFEYDNKLGKITHFFKDEFLVDGSNELKIVVTDNVGNSSSFQTKFIRKIKK